jgi:methylenetetrahydrofolate dehydrogenase (NADP+)/methenyltetrahydrofolate cyclohydrolase
MVCHSKTPNLEQYTKQADILVVAIGKPKYITADMVKPRAVVIDVGINRDENGKLCGDVNFEQVKEVASAITPVPGGCGPLTVAELLKNTVKLHNNTK